LYGDGLPPGVFGYARKPKPCEEPGPKCCRAAGWHCPPSSIFAAGRNKEKIGGTAGVFFVAGEIDLEPVRFETRAVRMDD
jgi:hypothetical protein